MATADPLIIWRLVLNTFIHVGVTGKNEISDINTVWAQKLYNVALSQTATKY
jgi:hypothetical protein